MNESIEFSKWILEQSFQGGDIAGDSAQEKAHELGLLKAETYDPEKHCLYNYSDFLELGQNIYFYSDKLEHDKKTNKLGLFTNIQLLKEIAKRNEIIQTDDYGNRFMLSIPVGVKQNVSIHLCEESKDILTGE